MKAGNNLGFLLSEKSDFTSFLLNAKYSSALGMIPISYAFKSFYVSLNVF